MYRLEFITTRFGVDRVAEGFGADHRPVIVEKHNRWRRNFALFIGDRNRFSMFVQIGDARIGGPQVDPHSMSGQHIIVIQAKGMEYGAATDAIGAHIL